MRHTLRKDVDLSQVSDSELLMEAVAHLGCNCGDWSCFSPDEIERVRKVALLALGTASCSPMPSWPPMAPVMLDLQLAAELQETLVWLTGFSGPHVDRMQRAIAFLRGHRNAPELDTESLTRLIHNDPLVHAIYQVAYHEAVDRIRGGAHV